MSKYTQLKLKPEYRERLKELAEREDRSMANMVEQLIDRFRTNMGLDKTAPKAPSLETLQKELGKRLGTRAYRLRQFKTSERLTDDPEKLPQRPGGSGKGR
jgi:hypothetical protein